MNILAIESSCDDTSAAVLTGQGIQSNVIASQAIHIKFGGVVPELASRAHQTTISQTVQQALDEAELSLNEIDLIAVTQGPGLMGSLLVGLCFAKGMALSNDIPIIGVNHMDAHIYANFIDNKPEFPFISLTVSGGHTQLVHVKAPFEHEILGKTRDDAAGEAFDKIGKVFGLEYPAGPTMDKLSQTGNPKFHKFPQALLREGLDFSFSGLKTSALYFVQDQEEGFIEENLNDLCASVSEAITEVLVKKLKRAVEQTGVKTIALAGGVSANSMLRAKTEKLAEKMGLSLHIPKITYCTDNAAMIAITGKMKAELGEFDGMEIRPFASV
ncbi:MAG TPA: tRNA (adenosine(37)-N6)-threonylcarbamoyltransferase complex transferase subunit TsaD [Balneola sp.]|jgi:N6-L-threonylcarbamoyladenine synthase|nr:tRNA (adenosine(37)-N6)-threonylcarbamoyltransferase complex transferase subunit TsaD [Balneola sp.]MBF63838.1 tRNA (adenosine(37)-N6)-threonylcarbamoyltransferase complex transferase subunit TsaD [Balneola sp.]HAH50621.1 tRNA (adenosine(37)-N6)-threonylcarbamoyltransferase complex transferase subunit TsaD [Balneola sp.]HAW78285.1 tRNA (adenosine(37)-N6)-threonylcarbamoyltransferase complex transferase subunit TsaD [Balneola sp.]|tara:strand:- start:2458 stop:3441 length:984 start_codon:yes stop_codon:yes gene_type:complete